jgi:hypothetical protein
VNAVAVMPASTLSAMLHPLNAFDRMRAVGFRPANGEIHDLFNNSGRPEWQGNCDFGSKLGVGTACNALISLKSHHFCAIVNNVWHRLDRPFRPARRWGPTA